MPPRRGRSLGSKSYATGEGGTQASAWRLDQRRALGLLSYHLHLYALRAGASRTLSVVWEASPDRSFASATKKKAPPDAARAHRRPMDRRR